MRMRVCTALRYVRTPRQQDSIPTERRQQGLSDASSDTALSVMTVCEEAAAAMSSSQGDIRNTEVRTPLSSADMQTYHIISYRFCRHADIREYVRVTALSESHKEGSDQRGG